MHRLRNDQCLINRHYERSARQFALCSPTRSRFPQCYPQEMGIKRFHATRTVGSTASIVCPLSINTELFVTVGVSPALKSQYSLYIFLVAFADRLRRALKATSSPRWSDGRQHSGLQAILSSVFPCFTCVSRSFNLLY